MQYAKKKHPGKQRGGRAGSAVRWGAAACPAETNDVGEMDYGDVRDMDILELESILELALEAHSNVAQPYCAMHTPCYHHAS